MGRGLGGTVGSCGHSEGGVTGAEGCGEGMVGGREGSPDLVREAEQYQVRRQKFVVMVCGKLVPE